MAPSYVTRKRDFNGGYDYAHAPLAAAVNRLQATMSTAFGRFLGTGR